ncbi:MAG: flagellar brake protein [Betaproteobacteria bacterium]|nr:flagellar brake protein [Betaproteobacteria bacterium]
MSPPRDDAGAGATGTLLVRSGVEIGDSLEAMCEAGDLLTASVQGGQQLFLSRLLRVDRRNRLIVVACSELRAANHALLESGTATFSCNHRGVHFEFMAGRPHEVEFAGTAAIQLDFPSALLALHRRAYPRFALPPRVPLRCVIEWGPVSFDARVVDISRQGIGAIIYGTGIRLEPGTRLPRARIEHPQRSVMVGLEVRHARKVVLPDGRPAMRAGCRLIGARHDLEDLIRLFVTDLDSDAPG